MTERFQGVCATLVGLTITDYLVESVDGERHCACILQELTFGVVERVVALPGCYADSLPSMLAGYW